jgi:hypothetical protein
MLSLSPAFSKAVDSAQSVNSFCKAGFGHFPLTKLASNSNPERAETAAGVESIGVATPSQAAALGLGRDPAVGDVIRPYRNGKDVNNRPRGVMLIDLFGLTEEDVRTRYPAIYQHLLERLRPDSRGTTRKDRRRHAIC